MNASNPETIYFAGSGDWTQARLITVSGSTRTVPMSHRDKPVYIALCTDPEWHVVHVRWSVMKVEYDYRHNDRYRAHYHHTREVHAYTHISYTVSQKSTPLRFSDIFPKRLGIFSPNFTHLLYVPIDRTYRAGGMQRNTFDGRCASLQRSAAANMPIDRSRKIWEVGAEWWYCGGN